MPNYTYSLSAFPRQLNLKRLTVTLNCTISGRNSPITFQIYTLVLILYSSFILEAHFLLQKPE